MRDSTVLSKTERRTRVLLALEDGEYRASSIAAWAELSEQAVRADAQWLSANGFVTTGAEGSWALAITDKGREYLAGPSDEEKDW